MTVAKTILLTAALVAVFVLGVFTGPSVRDTWSRMRATDTAATAVPSPAVDPDATAPVDADRRTAHARSVSPRAHAARTAKAPTDTVHSLAVSLWEPELRDRVKAVLNPGARLEDATDNFVTSEQFFTVAHAARSTEVPFMVLKDRVLNQGQKLEEAIHEVKPGVDARAEVTRARAAARADLAVAN